MTTFAFFIAFFATAFVSFVITPVVRNFAERWGVVDDAARMQRKVHEGKTPLLGGIGVFFAFLLVAGGFFIFSPFVAEQLIPTKHLFGIFLGALILMIGGVIDDRWQVLPRTQFFFPLAAALVIIASGIGIHFITNPFGGQMQLDGWQYILFWYDGIPYHVSVIADAFTLVWLLGMMYTTKFLDGLDGLVSGTTIIGALVIAALALDPAVHQNTTALLALILAGAFLGFLPWNWHPAKIFLGEGGSLLAGFMLGVLAIIAGSKVTTTVLVVGVPVLDALWVILRRLFYERRSPFTGDRKHLHHRLLDVGFSHRATVLILYFFSVYFGSAALFLQSQGKLVALVILSVLMIILGGFLVWQRRTRTV